MEEFKDIGNCSKRMREARKLTIKALAKRTDLSTVFLNKLEQGTGGAPKLITLHKLCKGLRINLHTLFLASSPSGHDLESEIYCLFRSLTVQEWGQIKLMIHFLKFCGASLAHALNEDNVQNTDQPPLDRFLQGIEKAQAKSTAPEEGINSFFGQHIFGLRTDKNMSPQDFAERSGLSRVGVSELEKGRFSPTLETLNKLCIGLGISLPELFEPFREPVPDEFRRIVSALPDQEKEELISVASLIIEKLIEINPAKPLHL